MYVYIYQFLDTSVMGLNPISIHIQLDVRLKTEKSININKKIHREHIKNT